MLEAATGLAPMATGYIIAAIAGSIVRGDITSPPPNHTGRHVSMPSLPPAKSPCGTIAKNFQRRDAVRFAWQPAALTAAGYVTQLSPAKQIRVMWRRHRIAAEPIHRGVVARPVWTRTARNGAYTRSTSTV
ncbi:hypothetical protein KCP70_17590 [Salmonella enterica subsp. enterica]|nr:hypothetical protein KCP70_17590 [Salmonella enterica subsp. enterica]